MQTLVMITFVISLFVIVFTLFRFNTLEWSVCHGVKVNDADYCNLYDMKCVAKPDHCEDNWKGFIARDRFHLASIVRPHLNASVLGWLWWLFELALAAVINLFLLLVLMVREPMFLSPVFWWPVFVLLGVAAYRRGDDWSEATYVEPYRPLNRVGRESPLGEATFAGAREASEALGGDLVPAALPPLFED